MISFASAVPSAPQTGHRIGDGMRPFSGYTSKAYFWPQLQTILTGTLTCIIQARPGLSLLPQAESSRQIRAWTRLSP
jgi:hypothetical protein